MNAPRQITSLTNPTVKAARALHLRKEREDSGLFLAEGLKIVAEAFEHGRTPRILMYGPDAADHALVRRIAAGTLQTGGEVIEVSREVLEKVSRRDNPQTVVAVFEQVFTPLAELAPNAAEVWVALQAVRDPGNLGTIVRTADAGKQAVHHADPRRLRRHPPRRRRGQAVDTGLRGEEPAAERGLEGPA